MQSRFASAVGVAAAICCALGLLFSSACPASANTSSPPVLGLDVYADNGTMNWSELAASGIQFAWAKATQGNYYQDAQLSNNESGATANGIYVGAYDFADPTNCTPLTEATYFVNYASQYGAFDTGKLLPALDMESVGSTIDGASSLTAWINAWASDVYTLSGVHPLLYCSPSFLSDNNITSTSLPLWEADWTYPSNLSNTGPPSGSWSPWSTWTFWQYTDKGTVNGDPASAADLDAYNGTLSQMIANEVIPVLTWTGNTNGVWDITSSGTQNWNYGTTANNAAYYFDGRAVVFPDANLVNSNSTITHSSISISSIVTPQSLNFTANTVNYTFTGAAIAGTGGLTLGGAASVTLDNGTSASPNTFSGAVAINKGQLILEQVWSLGNSSGATVASGGALVLNNTGSAKTFGNLASGGGTISLTIAGAGLTASPAGALESLKGNNTYVAPISLSANATIESASTASGDGLTLPGGVTTNGYTLTFAGPGTTTLSGGASGAGAVQITSGTLRITNSSPLSTGAVTLAGGTLVVAAPSEIGINIAADGGSPGSSSGEQPEQMPAATVAGVAPMSNWNNLIITKFADGNHYTSANLPTDPQPQSVASTPMPMTLNYASGAASSAQVTSWAGSNTYSVYGSTQTTGDAQLNNGLLGGGNSSTNGVHPATVTISNIPYTSGYTLYVYFNNNSSAQDAVISAASGSYSSPSYYVSTEGAISGSPFYTDGSGSTTAGNYAASDYVAIPIPADSAGGPTNSLTVTLAEPVQGSANPGITAIQLVSDDMGATLGNAVIVSQNSTINVTGVDTAAFGALSIGKTLFVTGGSTGAGNPYTLTLGATTLTASATFNVANNSSGSGALGILQLGAVGDGGHNYGITLTGPGEVALTAAGTYGGATNVLAGQLLLTNSTALGNSSAVSIATGGALALDNTGGASLTFGNTANGSTTVGLTINGTGFSVAPAGALSNVAGTNTYAGAVSVGGTGSATISAAASTQLTLGGAAVVASGDTLQFGGTGTVVAAGSLSLAKNAALQIASGAVQLNPASTTTIGSGVTVTVASGATLQLAGTVSALSNASTATAANIANGGTLSVLGVAETVATISGAGQTVVQPGANLSANQIMQTALIVGADSIVTIEPTGSMSSGVTGESSESADSAAIGASPGVASPSSASNSGGSASADAVDPFIAIEATILADNRSGSVASDSAAIVASLAAAESQFDLATLDNPALSAEYEYLSLQSGSSLSEVTLGRRAMIDKSIWNLENPPAVENDNGLNGTLDSAAVGDAGSPAAVPEPATLWLAALGAIAGCPMRRRFAAARNGVAAPNRKKLDSGVRLFRQS